MKKYRLDEEDIKVPRFEEKNGFYTTKERSLIMSKIKGKDTKPEIQLRRALWKKGIRYRINYKKLPGRPDIVILKYKIAIFVDGEFWHGYNWQDKKKKINSNKAFWIPKIERNMQRDFQNNQKLEEMDFKVLRFWANDLKKDLGIYIDQVVKYITENKST